MADEEQHHEEVVLRVHGRPDAERREPRQEGERQDPPQRQGVPAERPDEGQPQPAQADGHGHRLADGGQGAHDAEDPEGRGGVGSEAPHVPLEGAVQRAQREGGGDLYTHIYIYIYIYR